MYKRQVLHYAQEVFEGLKAYRHADGSIWSFRPEANAQRLQRSCRRLALPELPVDDFVGSLKAVSYTHLDVYKRQGLADAAARVEAAVAADLVERGNRVRSTVAIGDAIAARLA